MGNQCSTCAPRLRALRQGRGLRNGPGEATLLNEMSDTASVSSDESLVGGRDSPEAGAAQGSGGLRRTESLENLLTCPICLDITFEPVTSACNHHFCKSCLRRLLEYQGNGTPCPKCREPLNMDIDSLRPNKKLVRTVKAVFSDISQERVQRLEEEDRQYREARATREEHERMMEENPLQVMFDSEADPARRAILERDVASLQALGFSLVQAQKALFLWAGVHSEAVNWLIQIQSIPEIDVPWNMTQLQDQTLYRNSRRALLNSFTPATTVTAIQNRLIVDVSSVALVGTNGDLCWCFVTAGFHALGQSEIVINLVRSEGEEVMPDDVIDFLAHLYRQVAQGLVLDDMSCTALASQSRPFLGSPDNTGFIFCKYAGQVISGLTLPPAPFLFGVLLRGEELQWAKIFPGRLLLMLGRHYQTDFPYPLWSDRQREPLASAAQLKPMLHFAYGLRLPGTMVIRTRSEDHGFIQVLLPVEQRQQAVSWLEHWPAGKTLTILGGITRGADCFLVHVPGRASKAVAFNLPYSQADALGAVHCVLVQQRFNGGVVDGDGLVMGLTAAAFQHVIGCLKLGHSCEIQPSVVRGQRHLGLRVQFLPRAVIESGVAHLVPADTPHRYHPLAIAAASMPRGPTTVNLPAFISRQIECNDLHPRINIVGVTVVTPHHALPGRIDSGALDTYVCALVHAVCNLLTPHLAAPLQTTSTMVLHVDVLAEMTVRYRITKDWADAMPQAPAVNMQMWRAALHRVAVPPVTDAVNFHITFQVS
eukprot:m.229452 g.229452  ORF g.229452 m.229452 type:complete len:764 (-) comp11909_c0_seq1:132-2423(-)